jgi:hypothetical protein
MHYSGYSSILHLSETLFPCSPWYAPSRWTIHSKVAIEREEHGREGERDTAIEDIKVGTANTQRVVLGA